MKIRRLIPFLAAFVVSGFSEDPKALNICEEHIKSQLATPATYQLAEKKFVDLSKDMLPRVKKYYTGKETEKYKSALDQDPAASPKADEDKLSEARAAAKAKIDAMYPDDSTVYGVVVKYDAQDASGAMTHASKTCMILQGGANYAMLPEDFLTYVAP